MPVHARSPSVLLPLCLFMEGGNKIIHAKTYRITLTTAMGWTKHDDTELFTGYWSSLEDDRNTPQLSRWLQPACSRWSACKYQMKPDNAWEPLRACCVTMMTQPTVMRCGGLCHWFSSYFTTDAHSLRAFIFGDCMQMYSFTTACKWSITETPKYKNNSSIWLQSIHYPVIYMALSSETYYNVSLKPYRLLNFRLTANTAH